MELPKILARIEMRLKALKVSANAASNAAGVPDAIRNLRRAVREGKRDGLSTSTIGALAPVLQTTPAWLLTGEDTTSFNAEPLSWQAPARNGSTGIPRTQELDETLPPQIVREAVDAMATAIEAAFVRKMKRRPTDDEMEYLAQLTRELFGARRVLARFDRLTEDQTLRVIPNRKDGKEVEPE